MPDKSTHRKIIAVITEHFAEGKPFAVHELRDEAKVSTSSVRRTLDDLVELCFVSHAKKGYQGRVYRTTARWTTKDRVQNDFELAKVVGL
jgi:predicted transcriptional regulator